VAFEDVRHFAGEVLGHRMLLNYDGQAENLDITELVQECVKNLTETM
jgi:MoxR-like ATPase